MPTFKSFNNIVLDLLDYLRLVQPNLDIKPNSVARDLFIDGQALQVSKIYDVARQIYALQSIMSLTGQDLTNYGANYGISRQSGTKAVGTVVFTFRSLDSDFSISAGSIVRTRSGIPFLTVSSQSIFTSQSNSMRATATRLRQSLNSIGINDDFAIETSVEAQSPGNSGNISKYSIISHSIPNVNSVTNLQSFTSGTNLESDSAFRARILSIFSGTNVGTSLGYRSIILGLAEAIDALVIEPGDPLMTRDGTIVTTNSNGDSIVSEPGTGGKIDIYIMGENLQPGIDSFVYNDSSGKNDPTDSSNNYIMGYSSLTADTTLTLNSRRVSTLSGTAEIPNQPISNIVSVSGSLSGPNFVEQYYDANGDLKGNYKLIKDTGTAGNSSFGLDKFAWTSNEISLTEESNTKGNINSVDGLSFLDITYIPNIKQDIQVINENSTVSGSLRNYIITKHTPIRTVSRVFNLTTGERYTISDQTPDDTGSINTTGRVKISGRTFPTASDILQVDYTWIKEYDSNIDFDNLNPKDKINESQDSIEWGFSNFIRDESKTATLDVYNNLIVTTNFNISRVLSVNTFESETSVVTGSVLGKIIQVSNNISNIHKITDTSIIGNPEIFNTLENDGDFSNKIIILPTDSIAEIGDSVDIVYNLENIAEEATFINNEITLLPYNIISSGTSVLVNYVANFLNIIPQTNISLLPINGDGFNSFENIDGYQPVQNIYSGNTVVSNQRISPSRLRITLSGIPSLGTIRIIGTTINKVTGIFTVTANNTIDMSELIKENEGTSSISSNIYIARVISIESVTLNSCTQLYSTNITYDTTNYGIKDSRWDIKNAIEIPTLNNTSIKLSDVSINTDNTITTGTTLKVEFYYAKNNDYEDMFYSRNGTASTEKVFGKINSVSRLYGIQDSGGTISGKITIDCANQPITNTTYLVDYSYTAPKENERITINYEYNKLIVDSTEAIEEKRPITSDVLVKAASKIEIDVEASIVILSSYSNSSDTVSQNVSDNISSTLTASELGATLDYSDVINSAYSVAGLDRIRITRFNKTGISGTKLSIVAEKNEYLSPGNITITIEER